MVLEEQRPEDGFALLTATDPGYSIAPSHQPESSMALTFEWDPQKAARNHSKHGVAFEEAASALGWRPRGKGNPMKKTPTSKPDQDLREEYDFSGATRGKYHERMRSGSNLVVLDPDLAEVFSSSEAVNRALRTLVEVAQAQVVTHPKPQAS